MDDFFVFKMKSMILAVSFNFPIQISDQDLINDFNHRHSSIKLEIYVSF